MGGNSDGKISGYVLLLHFDAGVAVAGHHEDAESLFECGYHENIAVKEISVSNR